MAIALVPSLSNRGKLAHLARAQRAVRDRHPQHIGMKLQIQTILQTQWLKFIFAQHPVNPALHLRAEFCHPVSQKILIKIFILIHG